MIRIAIAGCQGRMGKALLQALEKDPQLTLTVATVSPESKNKEITLVHGVKTVDSLSTVMAEFDILIDFTRPSATLNHLKQCLPFGKKIVIGTTGLSEEEKKQVQAASTHLGIVLAPNTSVGVNVMTSLLKQAASIIGQEADIQIIEAHHKHKVDAPSGTALQMAKAITETAKRDRPIGFSSIRAGDIVGDHTVMFALEGERIEITHRAGDRHIFALGALRAAKWLAEQKNGLYTMQDVLGLAHSH